MQAKNTITHVRKDENGTITHVKINGTLYLKESIVSHMLIGNSRYYVPSGAIVRVVDNKYLRSDANNTKEDNLGELPECKDATN